MAEIQPKTKKNILKSNIIIAERERNYRKIVVKNAKEGEKVCKGGAEGRGRFAGWHFSFVCRPIFLISTHFNDRNYVLLALTGFT